MKSKTNKLRKTLQENKTGNFFEEKHHKKKDQQEIKRNITRQAK